MLTKSTEDDDTRLDYEDATTKTEHEEGTTGATHEDENTQCKEKATGAEHDW